MKIFAGSAWLVCLMSAPAFACVEPQLATPLPNGETASRDEMVAAQKAIRTYDEAVQEYSSCLQKSGASVIIGNDAVNKLSKIAEQFNAELRAFKKKNGA